MRKLGHLNNFVKVCENGSNTVKPHLQRVVVMERPWGRYILNGLYPSEVECDQYISCIPACCIM